MDEPEPTISELRKMLWDQAVEICKLRRQLDELREREARRKLPRRKGVRGRRRLDDDPNIRDWVLSMHGKLGSYSATARFLSERDKSRKWSAQTVKNIVLRNRPKV